MNNLQAVGVIALFVFIIVPLFGLFCIPNSRATGWWLGLINMAICFLGCVIVTAGAVALAMAVLTLLG